MSDVYAGLYNQRDQSGYAIANEPFRYTFFIEGLECRTAQRKGVIGFLNVAIADKPIDGVNVVECLLAVNHSLYQLTIVRINVDFKL